MSAVVRHDVLYTLDEQSATPLYIQMYEQIRDAIIKGDLAEGDRLSSIRQVVLSHNVSHTTVEKAYSQLAVEGYVRNVPRSGYVVEKLDTDYLQSAWSPEESIVNQTVSERDTDAFYAENIQGSTARYDFSYANLPAGSFPTAVWRRLLNDVLYTDNLPELSRYSNVDEASHLSVELAHYLARVRGVACSPHQVLPRAGTDGAIMTVLTLFDSRQDGFAMEEPGYATAREVASRMGFKVDALPVGHDDEFMAAVERHQPKIIYTTPSHQFPTGKVMPLSLRIALIQWAAAHDAYIIEDDSCSEYRYGSRPVPSLYSLDETQHTIYLNNVSKALSPSLRLAYLVLPPDLLRTYFARFNNTHPSYPWLEQEVMARFIADGHWDRQIRKTVKEHKRRHDLLLPLLEAQLGSFVTLQGIDAGMHVFATVRNGMDQDQLIHSALEQGAAVYGTRRMWFSKPAPENVLMIGYSSIPLDDIEPGVIALKNAWKRRRS